MKFKGSLKIIINLAIVVMVAYAWICMFYGEDGLLLRRGFRSLKYYTMLSNIFVGAVSGAYFVSLARGNVSRRVFLWKYTGVVAVFLTFLIVITFLGIRFGYGSMFLGPNLFMHLIVPLLAVIEFIFLDHEYEIPLRDTLLPEIPLLIYGAFYLGNIFVNGIGEGAEINDFYGFAAWGIPMGCGIFLLIILIVWLMAFLIRLMNHLYSA